MTLEQIILILLTAASGVIGWFCRQLYDAVKQLRQDLDNLRVHIANDYVRQDRMETAMTAAIKPVLDNLTRIETAVLHKVDKP